MKGNLLCHSNSEPTERQTIGRSRYIVLWYFPVKNLSQYSHQCIIPSYIDLRLGNVNGFELPLSTAYMSDLG